MINMPVVLALAKQGLQTGLTQEKVRQALYAHLERERRYLDRRKAQGQHTPYDETTEGDQVVLALAICWLMPDTTTLDDNPSLRPSARP